MTKSRIDDAVLEVEDHLEKHFIPYSSDFLDERQQAQILPKLKKSRRRYILDGGFDEAQRKLLILPAEYEEIEDINIPIAAIVFKNPGRIKHNQVLGTLLSLGIERDIIGDISIWEDKIQVVVHERMLEYFINNLNQIGGKRIKPVALNYKNIISYEPEYEAFTATVSSNRLDSVVSRVFGISRDKANLAIKRGEIMHNHLPATKPTRSVKAEDTISMRRKGKIKIDKIGERTKKGKIRFNYLRFK